MTADRLDREDEMTLAPLFEAGQVVQVHVAAALAAFAIGWSQFVLPKGTMRHRAIGWTWIILMALVSLSAFGIHQLRQFGPFSYIHVIALFTLILLPVAITHARSGRIEAHRWTMVGLFAGALVITGLFTLMPGRMMHAVVFGD